MGSIKVLDRELYEEPLAAQLLGVPPSTLHWWLEGRGKHEPVLRPTRTGSRTVTWGEFIEAQYLREYRRTLGVQLHTLRAFISDLRTRVGVLYPLAYAEPWVGAGRRLLIEAQEKAGVPPELWACFEPRSGLTLLTHPAESYLARVKFSDTGEVVTRLYPAGKSSPVVIDPEIRFGSPVVDGIPTAIIAEQVHAGDSVESVSTDFNLAMTKVVAALSYEDLGRKRVA